MSEVKVAHRPRTKMVQDRRKRSRLARRLPSQVGIGSPHTFLRRFAQEMDQIFEDFGLRSGFHFPRVSEPWPRVAAARGWVGPCRVVAASRRAREKGQFVVRADLPGHEQGRHQGGGH